MRYPGTVTDGTEGASAKERREGGGRQASGRRHAGQRTNKAGRPGKRKATGGCSPGLPGE
jgi:hypothetical protein